ncbi:POT family proton-dependent oligopeptide transporter [Saccharopolyspora lacisalsi]|uniref:POT family proton-dependent oligopeptide transporter n=1 Tax=Halosaccharopolyspora lacisalsi TaxID=1000566 RepID=A0A839DX96_9PSEU|nr:peptide MFS transporter [Halosaccharopolyspora lacisalsi]MBA8826124.1 POT family proton-dependent oligopeptide transporter [Halosaccharopolyspora lacisalsi]
MDRSFFGQPRGLVGLFCTEAWERFSYYGMRALLLYYMYDQVTDGGLGIPADTAKSVVAVYGSATYMAAILGGWISDRLLGDRRTTFLGGVLIMCGHICLALPAGAGALFASMIFIACGTGLLKPTVSSSVGDLYAKDDPRRDSGFSIYYMGISVGAVAAPLVVGTIGQKYDYHLGFGIAAIGMALGLVVYVRTQRHLSDISSRPKNPLRLSDVPRTRAVWFVASLAGLTASIALAAAAGLLGVTAVVNSISALAVALPIAYFTAMLRSKRTTPAERARVRGYIPLFIAAVFFWMIQEQGATVLAQYADRSTDLDAFGFAVPASWFQSVGSFVLIVLTPLFAALWLRMDSSARPPSTASKFSFALAVAGVSYLVLVLPSLQDGDSSPLWLVGSLVLVTIGEMCLSPIGLSATAKLAPAAFATQTMGLWLTAGAAGQGIAAQLVKFYSPDTAGVYFGAIGAATIVVSLVLLALLPVIRRQTEAKGVPGDVRPAVLNQQEAHQ